MGVNMARLQRADEVKIGIITLITLVGGVFSWEWWLATTALLWIVITNGAIE
jgi:hypothetical protein